MTSPQINLKAFKLLDLFISQTDEEHPLTTQQIIEMLSEQGVSVHRNTLPGMIDQLSKAGYDIICEKSNQNRYFLGNRGMDISEAKALCDAVNAARFISKKKSAELIEKLLKRFSVHQADQLRENIQKPSSGKITHQGLYNADTINTAIILQTKITFQYYDYDMKAKKKLKHNGAIYTVSPYSTVWNDDRYYLIGYCERHNDIAVFRIDRMTNVIRTDAKAIEKPADFDIQQLLSRTFSMYRGEAAEVSLLCTANTMKFILDKFGGEAVYSREDKDHFKIKVTVELSPTFYAWIFQYRGEIKLIEPKEAVEDYQDMLKNAIK